MSKVLKNPKTEAAQTYDFSNAKRGVLFERAKNGIKTYQVTDAEDRARATNEGKPGKP